MKKLITWLKWPTIFIFVAAFGLLIGLFLPINSSYQYDEEKEERKKLMSETDEVLEKIYKYIKSGKTNEEIALLFSSDERNLIDDFNISWGSSIPIKTQGGVLDPNYLPCINVFCYQLQTHIYHQIQI